MRFIFSYLVFILISTTSYSQDNEKLISQVFDSYKTELLNDRTTEAIKYLDSRTLNYYKDLLHHIKSSDSLTLEILSAGDKFAVLMVRHVASKKEILAFTDKSIIGFTIDNGMLGKNRMEGYTLGKIAVKKDFAKASVLENLEKNGNEIHFYFEENQWKINLTALLSSSDKEMDQIVKETGKTENEFMFGMLELMTERKPSPTIWKKIK